MGLDLTSFDYALKELYDSEGVAQVLYEDNPLLAMIPKWDQFYGDKFVEALAYGIGAGRSAVFATAQSNATNHQGVKFELTRARDYAVAIVSREVMKASARDPGALLEASKAEIDKALYALRQSTATALMGDGAGDIGRSSANPADTDGTVTLTDPEQIVNFEKGMKIVANPNRTGNSGTMRSGTGTVATIDRNAGSFTFSGTITGITTNDYIFVEGDYDAKIKGIPAWVPTSTPASTAFFGVDRTVDSERLAGVRLDGSSLNPDEALIKMAGLLGRAGAYADYAFMNFAGLANLETSLGTKKQYVDEAVAGIGFRGIALNGPRGVIKVFADRTVPNGYCWMLKLNSWKLRSLGPLGDFIDEDGTKQLRQAAADGFEIRVGQYYQLGCRAPGWNGVVTLPT